MSFLYDHHHHSPNHNHVAYREERVEGDDYHGYVTKVEKTTSITEGPHFPHLQSMHKEKAVCEEGTFYPGPYGRAKHFDRIEDTAACDYSEDAYRGRMGTVGGEYVRREHRDCVYEA